MIRVMKKHIHGQKLTGFGLGKTQAGVYPFGYATNAYFKETVV